MITLTKEAMYVDQVPSYGSFFLAGDIGGTNSNFGVFQLSDAPPLLILSVHYASQEITDFTALIKHICSYIYERYGIELKRACFGAAGIVHHHRTYAKPTNLSFGINLHEIAQATCLKELFLINDFEAVALGIDLINPADIILINNNKNSPIHGNKAFLGAGTGLGKSLLVWYQKAKRLIPIPSEGGHSDASCYDSEELELLKFISEHLPANCRPVSWEDLLSGSGIRHIYQYLATTQKYPITEVTQEIAAQDFNPDRISHYAKLDAQCKATFDLYIRFYARCAKNFALEVLALGGLYIAGGIAAKNVSLFFDPQFMAEFTRCGKHSTDLTVMPVYVISDYNISLYGAVVAMQLHSLDLL